MLHHIPGDLADRIVLAKLDLALVDQHRQAVGAVVVLVKQGDIAGVKGPDGAKLGVDGGEEFVGVALATASQPNAIQRIKRPLGLLSLLFQHLDLAFERWCALNSSGHSWFVSQSEQA